MHHRRPFARCAATLAVALALAASPALADDADARSRARGIAATGIAAYEEGRFEEAIARMREADAIFDAPHHDVYVARSLKQLGRWMEAREAYRAALTAPPNRPGFADARALAQTENDALEASLPAIDLEVEGGAPSRVLVDGRPVTPSEAGRIDVDPGAHRVRVETGDGRSAEQQVRLAQGVRLRVSFDLAEARPAEGAGPGAPSADREAGSSWVAPAIAFGIGGVGLVVGSITGIASLSAVGDLEEACPGAACPASEQQTIDSAETLANVSNVGFAVGAVGVAVGVVLLLIDGDGDEAATVSVLPVAPHPGGAAWRLRF